MSGVTLPESIQRNMNQYAIEWGNSCFHWLDQGRYNKVVEMIHRGVIYFGSIPAFMPNSTQIFPLLGIVRQLFSQNRFQEIQLIANAFFAHDFEDKILSAYFIMANHQVKRAIQIDPKKSQEMIKVIEIEKGAFEKLNYQGVEKMSASIAAIRHYLHTLDSLNTKGTRRQKD